MLDTTNSACVIAALAAGCADSWQAHADSYRSGLFSSFLLTAFKSALNLAQLAPALWEHAIVQRRMSSLKRSLLAAVSTLHQHWAGNSPLAAGLPGW